MKILQEVKVLNGVAEKLATFKDRYIKETKESRCDKYERKFNGDSRFSVFSVKANLCCHTGYYGSSSCSTFSSIDNTIAQKHFSKYLNKNMDEIISWMSESIAEEAASLTNEARKELEENMEFLKSIESHIAKE